MYNFTYIGKENYLGVGPQTSPNGASFPWNPASLLWYKVY